MNFVHGPPAIGKSARFARNTIHWYRHRAIKRAFDFTVAAIGLVLFSPTFLFVATATKLHSRGPVFCRQNSFYYGNKDPIQFVAFRLAAEARGLGGILRKTGIDKLPWLIHVLRGELSIVGPSLYLADLNHDFVAHLVLSQRRHGIKPGIIGWAQVHDCYADRDDALRQRVQFDLDYVEQLSPLFDAKIILMFCFQEMLKQIQA